MLLASVDPFSFITIAALISMRQSPRKSLPSSLDRGVRDQAQQVLEGHGRRGLRRLAPFLGPAFVAAVAYVDPGNFATNIQGGAEFGYRLLWVVLWANLMAMLIQALSAKLGLATGKNLPEVIREHYPRKLVWFYWVQAELIAMSTDLAEFLGAALGVHLLFGLPLIWGGLLTAVATFAILGLQRYGFRPLEAVITVLVGVIAGAYVLELFLSQPVDGALLHGLIVPSFQGASSVYLAAGILGATVMPHVIYLHSALTQQRIVPQDPRHKRRLYRFTLVDVLIAMGVAGFVNLAMLTMAAATFHQAGFQGIADITTAYRTLTPLLGSLAGAAFAISLLASGLSSTTVGTMAGQVIMQGFVNFTIPLWLRRAITMLPSLIVILLGVDPTMILIFSQVVLSFGIPFALIPLLQFTRDRKIVGELSNNLLVQAVGGLIAAVIIALNIFLLYQTIFAGR